VFVADAHEVVRLGLQVLLEGADDLELVGATGSVDDARQAVIEGWADIVLVDIDLDGAGGERLGRELAAVATRARYCFLVGETEPAVVAELSRLGASGFLHKRAAGRHVVDALRRLSAERLVLDPIMAEALMANLLEPQPRARRADLSERDLELLRLLGEGRTNKEIAASVFLSEKTVKNYLSRLFRKLGVRSRTEAALLSARLQAAPVAALAGSDR
jgi:DNA-binding NarL/FixJ family response regulator